MLLIYGVCAMWNARVTAVHAAIEGACREGGSSGSGVSWADAMMERMWPNQAVRAGVTEDVDANDPGVTIEKVTVQGTFIVPWLMDAVGNFLPNSAFIKAVATCPKQEFVPRPR
jgi:hypothetical protein